MALEILDDSLTSAVEDATLSIRGAVRQAADELAPQLAERVRGAFGDEGASRFGRPWVPTTDVALANRENAVYNPDRQNWLTLVDTGRLRDSIGEIDRRETDTGVKVLIGSDLDYAADMQLGSTLTVDGETFDVPRRPFQIWIDADLDFAEEIAGDVIEEALRG